MLNVLHISTSDNLGGSGRSAYRVHNGLRRLNVRSRMLVGVKSTEDPDVQLIAGPGWSMLDRIANSVTGRLSLQYLFYPSSAFLPLRKWIREADVVQLYNTHGGYFSHTVLPLISRNRPVVWRLSDLWPLTGHCAYSFDCDRWKTGCGQCPILSDAPELYRDTTAQLWRIKDWVYQRSHLTIVAPSKWIARIAGESPLLNRFVVHHIPNGLDVTVFRPLPKLEARAQLGLDPDRRVILFSAESVSDRRKGATYLREALEKLVEVEGLPPVTLLVVGAGSENLKTQLRFDVRALESTRDDEQLATIYSAADIFVLPTIAENLPNGVIESMACGAVPITFDVGGCADAVRHMETGYLAAYKDTTDLGAGIALLLNDDDLRLRLSTRSRQVVETEYSLELQAQRFKNLYERLVAERAATSHASKSMETV